MKNNRFFKWLTAFCLLLVCLFAAPNKTATASAATPSNGECVVEVSSRRMLHGRNADKSLPMASTTKILTAIIILDDCNLDDEV
ncbi:MAG: hypothetical protein K2N84_00110, partial [Clostridia bacterium]|nr:hypothetical protein [Clostridia bacterium]